jgi:hypothetical protein
MIEMTKRYKSFNLLLLLTLLGLVPAIVCAQDFLNLNTQITIEAADRINSKHLEFAPAYYGSGLVFVHAKEDKQQVDQRLGMSYFELMYAELGPDGKPGRARDFSPNIRTRFHEGPVAFSNDLKQIYFTRTNISNGQNVLGGVFRGRTARAASRSSRHATTTITWGASTCASKRSEAASK